MRADLDVAYSWSKFATQAVKENLAVAYPSAVSRPVEYRVAAHLHIAGTPGTYAPCSVDDLRLKDYDYWALGHVHQRQELSSSPRIIFRNLQSRHSRIRPQGMPASLGGDGSPDANGISSP
ncbi:MAG: hypothetical protein R3C12_16620 [Planctomycetaceae bacterium]